MLGEQAASGIVVHACNPNTSEAKTGRLPLSLKPA